MKLISRLIIPATFGFAVALAGRTPEGKAPLSALEDFSHSVQEVSARVAPAVVQIEATRYGPHQESLEGRVTVVVGKEQSVGSGVITSPAGYILTNAHVVSGAEKIRVTLLSTQAPDADKPDALITGALAQTFAHALDAKIVGISRDGPRADQSVCRWAACTSICRLHQIAPGAGRICIWQPPRFGKFDEYGRGEQCGKATGSRQSVYLHSNRCSD